MRCKLSENARVKIWPRLRPVCRAGKSLFILLAFAFLAGSATLRAQDTETPKTDGVIFGTAYLPGGEPASQVPLSLKSHNAGIFRSILTDYEGHFEFRGLPSGTYEFSIEEQGYEPYRSTAEFDGSSLKVDLHLSALSSPPVPANAYTISARELKIPSNAHNEFNKGLERLAKKDENGSLSHFMKAVKLFPGYFEALYHQGIVQTNLGQLEKAMQAFQKAVVLSGGRYARAMFGIGYLHYLQGDEAEAETTVRRGLEVDPNSPDGYVILGMTLLHLNRLDEAEKSAREALLRDPNTANAYLILADSSARRENYLEQIQDLDAYLRLDPNGAASKRAHEVRDVAQKLLNNSRPQN